MHVDVLKGPHHGSANNLEQDFFERILADHYVFSGDGQFGNPERDTLEMLAAARGDDDYVIHLTYPVGEIDVERKKDWEKHRADEQRRNANKPAVEVRAEWSDTDNSLAAFLAGNPAFSDKVVVVEEGVPHTIDLLGKR
jgi:beta-lactamase superfamily II metal-dependent hydrolase